MNILSDLLKYLVNTLFLTDDGERARRTMFNAISASGATVQNKRHFAVFNNMMLGAYLDTLTAVDAFVCIIDSS